MCNCIDILTKKLEENNIRLVISFSLSNPPKADRMVIETERINVRNRKGKYSHLCATYCPICGEKYPD